jgi:hypothetical protein
VEVDMSFTAAEALVMLRVLSWCGERGWPDPAERSLVDSMWWKMWLAAYTNIQQN